jgi:hypothetical protein
MKARFGGAMMIVFAAACGGASPEPASPHVEATLLAQAKAYERGTGVARDYHAAAEVYRKACDEGRGLASACGALIRAQWIGRGVALDRHAARARAGAICLAKRDPFGCVLAAQVGDATALAEPLHGTMMSVLEDLAPCDPAHVSACYARQWGGGVEYPTRGDRPLREALARCRAGVFASCIQILEAGATEIQGGVARTDIVEVQHRLQAACDQGDADACDAAPEREPIAAAALCTASDYKACALLGCGGDAAALVRATSHGIPKDACDSITREARERDRVRRGAAEAIAKMSAFRDRMCVCRDQACVDRVNADMTAWGTEMARSAGRDDKVSESDTKKMFEISESTTRCMTKVLTESPGRTP